jgi:hypothetical protein
MFYGYIFVCIYTATFLAVSAAIIYSMGSSLVGMYIHIYGLYVN